MKNNYYPFVNLPLPYDYDAMEPYIDRETMYLHHDKHLQTYIDNLNDILKNRPDLQKFSLEQLIRNIPYLPHPWQEGIRNNAGGVYNHRMFFDSLKPPTENSEKNTDALSTPFLKELEKAFGSVENFKDYFRQAALSVFGSGYAWLVSHPDGLKIITTKNQDCPLEYGMIPLVILDVWEHAYYLKHHNLRGDYIEDWFRVVNWNRQDFL